jgi:hypothetical protein
MRVLPFLLSVVLFFLNCDSKLTYSQKCMKVCGPYVVSRFLIGLQYLSGIWQGLSL